MLFLWHWVLFVSPKWPMLSFQKSHKRLYEVLKTSYAVKHKFSTLFQLCLLVDTTSWCRTTSNQRWSKFVYFNVGIYNVEQRRINVLYFNVAMNNVRQRRNNVVIFNVEFHSVGKRRNNVVKMIFFKKNKDISRSTRNSKF